MAVKQTAGRDALGEIAGHPALEKAHQIGKEI